MNCSQATFRTNTLFCTSSCDQLQYTSTVGTLLLGAEDNCERIVNPMTIFFMVRVWVQDEEPDPDQEH